MRVGIGYDIHPLVKKRDLFLGGVKVPHNKGCKGHSDADPLLHAICDSILGAIGEKDIGHHFPDCDRKYKNISSSKLLLAVKKIMNKKGYKVNNIDTVVLAQEPRISPYIDRMKSNIASILDIGTDEISVKATTTEGLGEIGKARAIAAQAIVSLDLVQRTEDRGQVSEVRCQRSEVRKQMSEDRVKSL